MVPLHVIILLIVVMYYAPVTLPGSESATSILPNVPSSLSPALTLLIIASTHLFLVLMILQRARWAVRALHNSAANSTLVSGRMDKILNTARWATIIFTCLHLSFLGWADTVNNWLSTTSFLKEIPLAAQTIFLIPPLLAWVGFWFANYAVDKAIRQRSTAYRLAQGLPTHDMPSRGAYVWMQARHNFYLLVPVALIDTVEELTGRLQPLWKNSAAIALPLLALSLLLVPWLITRIWDTVPMIGPLRARLDALAGKYRLRFRNILIWRTHNAVTNAAILGFVPRARYFLMTDALLESLTDRQIEAVFAHEVGHGVRRHLWWYAIAIAGWTLLTAALTTAIVNPLPAHWIWHGITFDRDRVDMLVTTSMLGAFMFWGFSAISRRFEHEADWFAAQHMAGSLEKEPLTVPMTFDAFLSDGPLPHESMTVVQYTAGVRLPAGAETPTTSLSLGAEVFNSALESIVELACRSRQKAGWMHPSVNQRTALLRQLATYPAAAAAFRKRLTIVRVLIGLTFLAGLATTLPQIVQEMSHKTGH